MSEDTTPQKQHVENYATTELFGIRILREKSNGSILIEKTTRIEEFLNSESFLRYARARSLNEDDLCETYEIDGCEYFKINPKCIRYIAAHISTEFAAALDNIIDDTNESRQQTSSENYNKKLVFRKLESDYKISADSTRKFADTFVEFTFESSMKVKQDLKDFCKDIKKGDNETYIFYDLREMYYHVNERKPKMTKFFNIKKYEDGSFEYKEGEGPYIAESAEEVEKILDAYIRHFRQK